MSQKKIVLASDNWAPAHPLVMQAVMEANEGYAPGYGADPWTLEAQKLIQEAFSRECKIFFVPTGTGSNVLALKLSCRRHESVICTDISHINYQESGAAESIVGCKLLTVPHENGKITPDAILKKLKKERAFGKHSTTAKVLSIAQPTEVGTVYTIQELKALSDLCLSENLYLHMDGSRLYNAAVSLNASCADLVSHVDILSLGGSKNGLMSAEALIIFNPALQEGSDHQHKQTLQLLSKMRYLAAQYIPLFKNNLWHVLATHANNQAKKIAALIEISSNLKLSYPVESNQLFFTAPAHLIPLLQEKVICHLWDSEKSEVRFITSWTTSEEDIHQLKLAFNELNR